MERKAIQSLCPSGFATAFGRAEERCALAGLRPGDPRLKPGATSRALRFVGVGRFGYKALGQTASPLMRDEAAYGWGARI